MAKPKHYIIGSSLLLALGVGGIGHQYITGPSEQQVQATAQKEGYPAKPIIPVKGDVPTIDHKTALNYLKLHMDKDAQRFNKTILNVPISQDEYDLYLDFTYQYGTGAWSGSSMLRNLKAGQYKAACDSLLKWKYVAKRDCSVRSNNTNEPWLNIKYLMLRLFARTKLIKS